MAVALPHEYAEKIGVVIAPNTHIIARFYRFPWGIGIL
jgi:hypothetical protein